MSTPPPVRGGRPALHEPAPADPTQADPTPAEPAPAAFLRAAAPGTRVVARHRIPGGFTDALGYLRWCDGTMCEIETRRGPVTVPLANVVAAKRVPEPPPRRAR